MVKQEDFLVERWMDTYETKVSLNIAETCCASLTLGEVSSIIGKPLDTAQLLDLRLTYGHIPGSPAARSAVASIYNETRDLAAAQLSPAERKIDDLDENNVILSNGAIGANFLVYYSLLGPGDHAIITDPLYQQLQSVPKMFGAEVDLLPLKVNSAKGGSSSIDDTYELDLEQLKSLLKKNTKLVIINTPHNPTGSVLSTEKLREIVNIVKSAPREGTEKPPYIHCDEVYRPVFLDSDPSKWPISIVHLYDRGISTSSATKAYGLAGLRLGWLATHDASVLEECLKRRDYNTISVSQVDDFLLAWALGHGGWKKILDHHLKNTVLPNVDLLVNWLESSNGAVSCPRPQGGTVVLVKVEGVEDTVEFCKGLANDQLLLVVPGETFNRPGTFRIGFANDPADMKKGLEIIKQVLIEKRYVSKPWNQ